MIWFGDTALWSPLAAAVQRFLAVQVLIVTDQPLVALGLRHVITAVDPDTRTETAESLAEALAMRERLAEPILLVVDLDTRVSDREALVMELIELAHARAVLALTGEPDEDEARRLRFAKAGYARKDTAVEGLRAAVLDYVKEYTRRPAYDSAAFSR